MTAESRTGATAPAAAAAPAADYEHDPPARPPVEEAALAIEEARSVIAAAVGDIESGDAGRLARAYESAAGCADHIARALWFLRRAEREARSD